MSVISCVAGDEAGTYSATTYDRVAEMTAPTQGTNSAWHYTSASGLLGVLASGGIWASTPSALNDASEISYGVGILREVWAEMRPSVLGEEHNEIERSLNNIIGPVGDLIYVLSASLAADSLAQWRGYAGSEGYAIRIDTSLMLEETTRGAVVEPKRTGNHIPVNGWSEVLYARAGQRAAARRVIDNAIAVPAGGRLLRWTATQQLFAQFAVTVKHEGFAEEREIRFIYSLPSDGLGGQRFRAGYYGLTSFVELRSPVEGRLPIREVMCGPTGGSNTLTVSATRRALRNFGYSLVDVSESAIPFRP